MFYADLNSLNKIFNKIILKKFIFYLNQRNPYEYVE